MSNLQTMPKTDTIMISDEFFDSLMQEVRRMPLKKRKQFKSLLTDKNGVKTKLKFDGEHLLNYSLVTRRFEAVLPRRYVDLKDAAAVTAAGLMVLIGFDISAVVDNFIEASHTGNHAGRVNHTVKVPAPGTW